MNFDVLNRIKKMKQTLLDLKTAKRHGLGTVQMYNYKIHVPKGSGWDRYWNGDLTVKIKKNVDTIVFPPVVQVGVNYTFDGWSDTVGGVSDTEIKYVYGFLPSSFPAGGEDVYITSNTPVDVSYTVGNFRS